MNWFFEHREIPSEKNGVISVTKKYGRVTVSVDGCEQTGPKSHAMWGWNIGVVNRYRGIHKIKSILLLGLGGGGEVSHYLREYPGASITIVEFDPAMVSLARELNLFAPYALPQVMCEDATTAVPKLSRRFDLIVVDLFKGPTPSPLSEDEAFLGALEQKLEENGLILVNVFRHAGLLARLSEKFSVLRTWHYGENVFGLFARTDAERAVRAGYLPIKEWPDHSPDSAAPALFDPSRSGESGEGVYWRLWPFSFELFKSDTEPRIVPLPKEKRAPLRIVMWQRLLRSDVPHGWTAFSERPEYKIGFVPLSADYEKRWSESARRGRKKWLTEEGERYRIEPIPFEEFRSAYMKSTIPFTMKSFTIEEVLMRMRNPKTPVSFLGVRKISNGKIVAGMAVLESTSVSVSYYHSGFFLSEAAHEPVMEGLFDRWFKDSLQKGIKFIDFGNFWTPGKDGDWKGFSAFKAKFNPSYFYYPPRLFRFSLNGN